MGCSSRFRENLTANRRRRCIPEDSLHPSNDFVGGGIRGLVKVDDTGSDIRSKITLERGASSGDGGEMTRPDEN